MALDAEQSIERTKQHRNDLRLTIENARKTLQEKFIEQNTARLNVVREEEKQKEAEGSLRDLQQEKEELNEQLAEIEKGQAEADAQLKETEAAEAQGQEEAAKAQEELKSLQEQEQEIRTYHPE